MIKKLVLFGMLIGLSFQMNAQTVANLSATGTGLKWYITSSGGTALDPATALENGQTYYASQTVNGQESTSRMAVVAKVNPKPQGSLSANGPFCSTGAGQLTWTATTGTGPYTIVYNDGTSNRTASSVSSGTAFNVFTTPVVTTTSYTLVSVTDANCSRTTGFTGNSATITIQQCAPVVSTAAATQVISSTAILNGNITGIGGSTPTFRGFKYSTTSGFNPATTGTSLSESGSYSTGAYSLNATGLTYNTTYYVVAFATNTQGTAYGTEQSFSTMSSAYSSGLLVTYYNLTGQSFNATYMPDYTQPVLGNEIRTDAINYSYSGTNYLNAGRADQVGAVFTGFLYIPTAGNYTFYSSSDDGTRLYLDGSQVINNPGEHGLIEVSGSVNGLTMGMHTFKLEYYNNGGGAETHVYWQGPGITKELIPASRYYVNTPAITTQAASGIGATTVTLNANISSSGATGVTTRGFKYSTTSGFNPATSGTYLSQGGSFGTGAFSLTQTGLSMLTTYYFVSYATNSAGTTYGAQMSFTTTDVTVWTFSNAGATGNNGPTQSQVNTAYSGTSLQSGVTINTQGIQEWTVPATGSYSISAYGAQGARSGGLGAQITGTFTLTAGEVIKIVVGQTGSNGSDNGSYTGGGGGGGSFVVRTPYTTNGSVLVIAGGGGGYTNFGTSTTINGNATSSGGSTNASGGGTSGNGGSSGSNGAAAGGGGFLTDGVNGTDLSNSIGGSSFLNGAVGGTEGHTSGYTGGNGGFGGGGGGWNNTYNRSGGGGGYSGGQGGGWDGQPSGGGGGSYNNGTNQTNTAASRSGMGQVVINKL